MSCDITTSHDLDIDFTIEEVIPKLEGLRTLIVYDSQYIVRGLIFNHIIPHFSSKDISIAVYSDTMMRRLAKTYEFLPDENIKRFLDNAKIIKIGHNRKTPFGKLHTFIDINSEWWKDLSMTLSNLGDSLLLFHGFSLLPIIHGYEVWRYFMRIFDSLPDDITFVNKISSTLYEGETKKFMERFHDVIIGIKWEGEFSPVSGAYWIGVEQSIIFDVKPGYARYRISGEGDIVKV